MTTIVEKTSDGIIYRAAKTYPIPDVDVLTLLFGKYSEETSLVQAQKVHMTAR
jgi:4-coumarate--CoA ligase